MFLILYYDVNEKRCPKMLKTCRKYLKWVQNSVFEGELTKAKVEYLKKDIEKIIKEEDEDSVVIYQFRTLNYSKRDVVGYDKKNDSQFL
ncbi:MAG: CRISPR-associated endonuclease Cas2 [Candidatus Mcinerneyibacterium aminivorans]|uniref:CRISPR-associated endoribonuclease Cas2 n=1 Tax=Candidatus Mcinerneyibacterium aminivorans TaxID=2703815 RepID=A0A5D0MA22_9BACT|nr:MAG: CRISPR-associated endonuclease Cas2 [Candidatus Mcinerneyibacterium aminivorans]